MFQTSLSYIVSSRSLWLIAMIMTAAAFPPTGLLPRLLAFYSDMNTVTSTESL